LDGIFWNTGDKHNEESHITEDPDIRKVMMNKRMEKLKIAYEEIEDQDKAALYGVKGLNALTVISCGSTKGAILDAMDKLIEEGKVIRFVQLRLLNPFPSEGVRALIEGYTQLINIVMNYSSQLASLVRENMGISLDYLIYKYNGRPISSSEVYNALTRIISGDVPRRIILDHGA
jgi:2-oxoglutarate/2-oxoacid ferredoxin oxidoreductase subunit alpha